MVRKQAEIISISLLCRGSVQSAISNLKSSNIAWTKKRHTQLFYMKADKFETANLANDLNYAHILDNLRTILRRVNEIHTNYSF